MGRSEHRATAGNVSACSNRVRTVPSVRVCIINRGQERRQHEHQSVRRGQSKENTDAFRDSARRNWSLKSTTGSNKMFPAALSWEFQFPISTCQRGNLSEGKAIYTGIKCMVESISDVVSIGLPLFWKLGEEIDVEEDARLYPGKCDSAST